MFRFLKPIKELDDSQTPAKLPYNRIEGRCLFERMTFQDLGLTSRMTSNDQTSPPFFHHSIVVSLARSDRMELRIAICAFSRAPLIECN